MSPICPQLTQLYQAWSDSLTVVTSARLRYQETASIEDKTAFDQALLQAKKAQENYREVTYAVVEYRGSQLVQIEALVMGGINDLLRDSNVSICYVDTNQVHVNLLSVSHSNASTSSINRVVALGVSYLRGLEILDCFDTNLSSLPNLPGSLQTLNCSNTNLSSLPDLPGSLRHIDIQSTPAAKDPEVQKKLKAFQEAHPSAQVFF